MTNISHDTSAENRPLRIFAEGQLEDLLSWVDPAKPLEDQFDQIDQVIMTGLGMTAAMAATNKDSDITVAELPDFVRYLGVVREEVHAFLKTKFA